ERAEDILVLDQALNRLIEMDGRRGKIVELRGFGGLSVEETAEILGVAPGTGMRDWRVAKAWPSAELWRGAWLVSERPASGRELEPEPHARGQMAFDKRVDSEDIDGVSTYRKLRIDRQSSHCRSGRDERFHRLVLLSALRLAQRFRRDP